MIACLGSMRSWRMVCEPYERASRRTMTPIIASRTHASSTASNAA